METVGRKGAFIGGSIGMGVQFLIIALIVKYNPPAAEATGKISSPGAAAIAMVYLEAAMYNLSWGPVAWYALGTSTCPWRKLTYSGCILAKSSLRGYVSSALRRVQPVNGCSTSSYPR